MPLLLGAGVTGAEVEPLGGAGVAGADVTGARVAGAGVAGAGVAGAGVEGEPPGVVNLMVALRGR